MRPKDLLVTTSVPQPTFGRVVSILWFPFFLAAVMSVLFVAPLAHPTPHDMTIAVAGDAGTVTELQHAFDQAHPGGFRLEQATPAAAAADIREGRIAAAIITGDEPAVLYASAAGATRAEFLKKAVPEIVGFPFRDLVPSAPGDATGTGVFFYALPIAIVAMVSAIVLLQLGVWSYRRKMLAVAVIAVFTAVITFLIAVWQQVVPATASSSMLLGATVVLVLGIGWTLTGAAAVLRQFLVPVALIFVLVLGVPTAGAPVVADMLPAVLGWLHEIMPMGQFITLVRALAYGVGSPVHPIIVLLGWLIFGAVLVAVADRRDRARRQEAPARSVADPRRVHGVTGTVSSLSGSPVPHADVWVLDDAGGSVLRSETDSSGSYAIAGVSEGVHHILVTAPHAEPEIISISVHRGAQSRHDFALQLWDDPAANLTADSFGER
jgi:hypothetical protein